MRITPQETRVLANIIEMIGQDSPTSGDLEDYIVGYGVLGRLIAQAQLSYEEAEMERKVGLAEAIVTIKTGPDKVSDTLAKSMAEVQVKPLQQLEIREKKRLMELKATRETVQEIIWAIKYLGREGG